MTRRGQPSHRHYTELCNRSGSPQLQPAYAQTDNADALEDYWEDASVSLRSFNSWEAPSSAWLSNSSTHMTIDEEVEETKTLCDLGARIRPRRYSFDASDFLGSVRERRSFPPPMASCSTLSFKGGGRFVLKEMDTDRPQGFFRAQRENGRLLLQLVLPDELDEEDATVADDGHDDVDEGNDGGEDEDLLSVVEYREEAGVGLCERFGHVEYDAHGEECVNQSDNTPSKDEVNHCIVLDGGCSTSQDASNEGGSWIGSKPHADGFFRKGGGLVDTSCISSRNESHFVANGSFEGEGEGEGEGKGDVRGPHQQLLWDVDVANHARASLSPWSSNPLCLHQPLVTIQPAISLAMF